MGVDIGDVGGEDGSSAAVLFGKQAQAGLGVGRGLSFTVTISCCEQRGGWLSCKQEHIRLVCLIKALSRLVDHAQLLQGAGCQKGIH